MKNLHEAVGTRRQFWAIVAAILVIALALRLPGLGTRSLWIDELYSEWFAARSFTELWTDVPYYETHPPVYYSLLRLWTLVFGNSELGLRSLSLVFTLVTVFTLAISGRFLEAGRLGESVGLVGAALLAVNYANIRDAQNARPYALQTFVCTIAVLAAVVLVQRLRRDRDRSNALAHRDWLAPAIILGVSAGLGLWIHNTGFFIALGIWAGLALTIFLAPAEDRLRQLAIFFAAGVLALLVWAPYLPIFLEQSQKFMALAFWLTPKTRDLYSAWMLLLGPSWPVVLFAVVLLASGLYKLGRRAPALSLLVGAILLIPLYVMLAVSFSFKPIYIQRLFAWMVPLALTVMALGLLAVWPWRWLRILLILAVFSISVGKTVYDYDRPMDDWKALIARIARESRPGDVVIAVSAEGSLAVDYYARRHAGFPPIVCVPGCYPQRNLPRQYISNLGAPRLIEADGEIVERALKTYRRVWLVQVSVVLYDPKAIVRSRIDAARSFKGYTGNSFAKVELFE